MRKYFREILGTLYFCYREFKKNRYSDYELIQFNIIKSTKKCKNKKINVKAMRFKLKVSNVGSPVCDNNV